MIFRYGVYLLRDVEDYSGSFVSSIVGNLFYIVSMFLVLLLGEEGEEMTRLVNSAITFARGKRLGLIRCQLRQDQRDLSLHRTGMLRGQT